MDKVPRQTPLSSYKNTVNTISEMHKNKQRAGTYIFNLCSYLRLIKVIDRIL